jgi:NADH-quinone oxidoreductase subunit G
MGTKPDLEIIGLIAKEMGLAPLMGPWLADTVFEEIRKTVPSYNVPAPLILAGGAAQANPVNGRIATPDHRDPIRSAHDNLFTSGNLGRYSKVLHQVLEGRG